MTICAAPDCENEFARGRHTQHQIYCSKRCRNHVAKAMGAERDASVSKHAKRLRMEAERLGGTVQGGAMVSGTRTLWRRAAIDVANTPADDPRFF